MSSNEPSLAGSGYPAQYSPPLTPPTTPIPASPPLGNAGLVPPPPESFTPPPLYPSTTDTADTADEVGSTQQAVKDEAGKVAGQAGEAAQQVAGVAKDQAAHVAEEAKSQVKELWSQTRSELTDQAGAQQNKAAAGLRSLGDQLQSMAERAEEPGVATDLAGQAADRVHEFAGFLENRDPAGLLDEVRAFARRRPGAFLAVALGAGMLTGRLARGLAADPDESTSSTATATRLDQERQAPALTTDRPTLSSGMDYPMAPAQPGWDARP